MGKLIRQLFYLDEPTFVALWNLMDFSFIGRRDLVLARGTNILIIGTSTTATGLKE